MIRSDNIVPIGKMLSVSNLRRRQLAAEIHAMLDRYEDFGDAEDDPDLEEGGDLEPAPGWTHTMALGGREDVEEV